MIIVVGIAFAIISLPLAVLAVLGLPGTWLVIALAALVDVIDWFTGDPETMTFGIPALVIAIAIAILAEIVEFLAGAAGAKAGGASRRGTVGALIGGFAGGIVGTFLIPIPLIGTLTGAALGAGGGALIGEISRPGVSLSQTFKPATGAAAGRVAGTIAKLAFAIAIWLQLTIAAFLH